MQLSKTTMNFAKKRSLDLYISFADSSDKDSNDFLFIDIGEDLSEPTLCYIANKDGSYTFSSLLDNRYKDLKEELPATIKDEKHLREVLSFISNEVKQ